MAGSDVIVRAIAVRWHDRASPGWVEVRVTDAHHLEHRIVEKAAVLSSRAITTEASLPLELWLAAEMVDLEGDEVRVRLKHGVATVDEARELVVASHDVKWL